MVELEEGLDELLKESHALEELEEEVPFFFLLRHRNKNDNYELAVSDYIS